MAFVLDVNLRIREILGLQKIEASLAKLRGAVQTGVVAGGGAATGAAVGGAGGMAAAAKMQVAAAAANAAAINKVTVANNKLTASQGRAVGTTRKAAASMKVATKSADSFGRSIAIAGKRYGAFLAATVVPFAAIAGIGKATASVIEFDTAILKMRQIIGQTEPQIVGMRNTILDLATNTGTSASEIARIGKIMAQAGFRGDQLAEALGALSKVPLTPSFETMDAAVEGTIAALNQFNKEGLTTTEILDVLTAVSNRFAASSEDIAKGIARGGAAFEAIGGTFREFVAIFTTVRHATRESSETVGTFMKTISSRLADPKIVNFLEGKGIRIGEAIEAGDPVAAMKQIAVAMENITSIQDRMEIGTRLGGRRQISRLSALISNVEMLNGALETAEASAGEFGKIAEVGLEGLQAQLNILGQEFNKLILTLAEPLFIPIIKGVTQAGKAFISLLDFIKPVIPAFITLIGFAAGFKLLAISIGAAAKSLAYMSAVGVGGGLSGLLGAFTGAGVGAAAAGGVAGTTARERIQRRMAGGVGVTAGGAAVAGGAGAGLLKGVGGFATSKLGQLGLMAGVIFAANKLSESFEETGESAGLLGSEFVKSTAYILAGISLLSGKSVTEALGGAVRALGPFGTALAAAVAALGVFTYAAIKAVDIDIQVVLDAAAKKIREMKIEPIEPGDIGALQEAIGDLGVETLSGMSESLGRYEEGLSGAVANTFERLKNFFKGEGLVTLGDADVQEMIKDMVGENPKLLNEILRSAVEQFGTAGLEAGIDQLLAAQMPSANIQAITQFRQAMITQLGGLDKISKTIDQIQMEAQVSKLANAIEKASDDFETLYIPTQLGYELVLLSDAVGNAAKAIQTNVTVFDKLSQMIGQDIGIPKPEIEYPREVVEKIVGEGRMGEFMDLKQFEALTGFSADIAFIGQSMEDFMKTIFASKAKADSLRSALIDPQADPFDVIDPMIDEFVKQFPGEISPETISLFKAKAASLAQQLEAAYEKGLLPDTESLQKLLSGILDKERPFYDASIAVIKTWLESQAQQLNLGLSSKEFLAKWDVGTAELKKTIVASLVNALEGIDIDPELMGLKVTGDRIYGIDEALIELNKDSIIVKSTIDRFSDASKRHGEILRELTDAQNNNIPITAAMREEFDKASSELLDVQKAMSLLEKAAMLSPQALAEYQARPYRGEATKETREADARHAKQIDNRSKQLVEFINRERQFIETMNAIEISEAFKKPAEIWADELRKSTDAIKTFTTALTSEDLQRGFAALTTKITPEGRVYTERRPIPAEARVTEQQEAIETKQLQAALFGGDIANVMEALLQSSIDIATNAVARQMDRYEYAEAEVSKIAVQNLRDFSGFIYDIPKMIKEAGLDPTEVARGAAKILQEQAKEPGIREVEHIGALERTTQDLTNSLKTLIERPEVARQPEELIPQLTPAIQERLMRLTPAMQRVPETEIAPRVFKDISASATNIETGGNDILIAGQGMVEASQQMQAIADTQREVLAGQQKGVSDGAVGGESTQEAMKATTEAINVLGEKMNSMTNAVETQTQQEAELSGVEREKPLEIDGLEKNTEAVSESNEIAGKTQEDMSNLNTGMTKIAGAMEEGIGIDIETMSDIKVDVQGLSEAAKEFTSEFEAVAHRVVKEEIRIVLQQLARAAGNSEAANTFESVIT